MGLEYLIAQEKKDTLKKTRQSKHTHNDGAHQRDTGANE